MATREEITRKAEEIVRKVAEATVAGGAFRIYHEYAVQQIVELVDAELRAIVAHFENNADADVHQLADALLADLKVRLRP